MALSYKTYNGDGSNAIFPVSIPYLNKSHIHVFVDDNDGNGAREVEYEYLTPSSIRLTEAPILDAIVKIQRKTPTDERVVDYKDGSTLGETELDRQADQLLYMMQESVDSITEQIQVNDTGNFDAQGKIISNAGTPRSPNDVATKAYVDTGMFDEARQTLQEALDAMSVLLQYKNDAAASAAAAQASEQAAAVSEDNATTAAGHISNVIYTNFEGAI